MRHIGWYVNQDWKTYVFMFFLLISIAVYALIPGWLLGLSTIKNADKIVVLENGLKVEEGTHKQLIANNGTYANIYRSQIKTSV